MCFVSRPTEIVTFPVKNGDHTKWIADFLQEKHIPKKTWRWSRISSKKSYNDNDKPWRSLRNLREKPNTLEKFRDFLCFSFIFSFFISFTFSEKNMFSIFLVFCFCFFPIFSVLLFCFFQLFFSFVFPTFSFFLFLLTCINVMTPFSLRDSNQRTACARSVRVSPHVCCQAHKVQVSVSNNVSDATGSRVHTTSIHKYPPSVSCHVPRCSILSQHISPMMRPNELPQNPICTPLGDDDCNVFRLSGMSSLPLTLFPGAQRIKTMLTSVTTRSVQSSS